MRKGQKVVERRKPTPHGYIRIERPGTRKKVFEHVHVWEQHHGPKPKGMDVHHKDENRLNNDISNLELLTRTEHRRHHEKLFEKRDGVWWKYCRDCKTWKKADEDFYTKCRHSTHCKMCWTKRMVKAKQERRERKALNGHSRKRKDSNGLNLRHDTGDCHSGNDSDINNEHATPGAASGSGRGAPG